MNDFLSSFFMHLIQTISAYTPVLETIPLLLRLRIEASCAWLAHCKLVAAAAWLWGRARSASQNLQTFMEEPTLLLWGAWLQSRACAYGVDCPDVGERGAKAGCVRPWRSSVARGAGGKTFVMKLSFSEKHSGFW